VKKNEKKIIYNNKMEYRVGTSDDKVMNEIYKQKIYEKYFSIESTDNWLDLGACFGAFTVKCLNKSCYVRAVEPQPDNFKLLQKNVSKFKNVEIIEAGVVSSLNNNSNAKLYIAKSNTNHWRHTIIPVRGRKTIDIMLIKFETLLQNINAIKMDIEGAEIEILEQVKIEDLKNINKMVIEWSYDKDRSIARFLSVVDKLKKVFKNVKYLKTKESDIMYNYYPACDMIYCWN